MNLDKNQKYVVACSFGPDSMALLDMMIKNGYSVVVAHVNYHKRKESDDEQTSLEKYCKNFGVPLFVLDTKGMAYKGNFQEWARNVRYEFFNDVLLKNNCDAVVVAHQQDDLLETYLMQKSKKSFVNYFGIREESKLYGVNVVRPLLNFTKKELEEYDLNNNVPYSIDSSNNTNMYTRNKFRHNIVEKLSESERKELLKEIDVNNRNNTIVKSLDLSTNIWDLQEFLMSKNEILILQISENLQQKKIFKKLTIRWIEDIKKSFQKDVSNIEINITNSISLFKSYSKVYLIDLEDFKSYSYRIDKPGKFSFEFIDFDFRESDNDRNITKLDFPIEIKPVSVKEKYEISGYLVAINRLFLDWKMPRFLRGWWPGIYNKDGCLVYIPRYRETYTDNHTSKLVIKFPKF